MHLVYSQGEEITEKNDPCEDIEDYCLNKLHRLYSAKVFKERFGRPYYRYVFICKTSGKPVRKQEGFLVESYFINPRLSMFICFGDYL